MWEIRSGDQRYAYTAKGKPSAFPCLVRVEHKLAIVLIFSISVYLPLSFRSRLDDAHGLPRHNELPQYRPLEGLHPYPPPPEGQLHLRGLLDEPLPLELLK